MERKTSTEAYDSYLEYASNHLKVFNTPARNTYQNKCRCVFVFVIFILLVTIAPVYWNNHTNLTESTKVEKQNPNQNNDKINATVGVLHVNITGSVVDTGVVTTSFDIKETTPSQNVSEKEKVLNYLHHITGKKTISGLFVSEAAAISKKSVPTFQKIAGVSPGIINKCMPKYEANKAAWSSFVSEVISYWKDYHFVSILWYSSAHPLESMDIFTNTSNTDEVEERWNDLVNEDGHLNKVWKRQLDLISPYLQQIQTAGVVVMLDIFPMTNYNSGIWSGRPGAFGTAKLYKLTKYYLTKHHNLTSFIWIWSVVVGSDGMNGIQQFWLGNDYVDVVSVYVWPDNELPMSTYHRLVEVVGDKPLSMEIPYSFPTPQLLALQPRWTWFTTSVLFLQDNVHNNDDKIKTVFTSLYVINKDNIEYFKETNGTT